MYYLEKGWALLTLSSIIDLNTDYALISYLVHANLISSAAFLYWYWQRQLAQCGPRCGTLSPLIWFSAILAPLSWRWTFWNDGCCSVSESSWSLRPLTSLEIGDGVLLYLPLPLIFLDLFDYVSIAPPKAPSAKVAAPYFLPYGPGPVCYYPQSIPWAITGMP